MSEHAPAPFVEVAVDARTTKPGDLFTYAVPGGMCLQAGHLVRVPFGKRTLNGVVIRTLDRPNVDYTKPVAARPVEQPLLSPARLELAAWIAEYYQSPLFDALAAMLPPGMRSRSGAAVRLIPDAIEPARLGTGARSVLAHLRAADRPVPVARLTSVLGPWVPNALRMLDEAGLIESPEAELSIGPPPAPENRVLVAASPAHVLIEAATGRERRAPRQAALASTLTGGPIALGEARATYGRGAVDAVVRDGLARIEDAGPAARRPPVAEAPVLPTPAQAAALGAITRTMDDPNAGPRVFLLQGVTGSGKTEVYLQALAHCMERGKRAIALVPELSLTPQTVQRFEQRFPGNVGVLHSGLSPGRHRAEWWRAFQGRSSVVVGPRSAVFAPMDDLGLIVLDEEHEWTYKQVDSSPRYHARTVALKLAELTGAVVVLGSATPDVETAYQAERGNYGLLSLPDRIQRSGAVAPLPDVSVVDMREELRAGNHGVLSRELDAALRETHAAGRQSILFLNRRGAASVVECRTCGQPVRCSRCSTPYTYHAGPQGELLVCHHCNRRRGVPHRCPACRSDRIRFLGLGTQRLAADIEALMPSARVLRWDRDTASTVAAHEALLRRFSAGEADILVGTQMVAKGLDIPSVALVGVVLADIGLYAPDIRAAERTFQLITQVSGRAGRGPVPGRAVVQTYLPEHYAVLTGAAQDYHAFYAREMAFRRTHGYPPVGRLIRLSIAHAERETAQREAARMAARLRLVAREWDMHSVDVIGPAPSTPARLRGAWRWHLTLRGTDPRALLDKVNVPPGWAIDVDPIGS